MRYAVWTAGLFVFWSLTVGSLAPAESVAGLAASLGGMAAVRTLELARDVGIAFRLAWIPLVLARLPRSVVAQTIDVLVRGQAVAHGRFVEVPFAAAGDDPLTRGRRALVVAAMALAPNSYAIAASRRSIVKHELMPYPPPSDPEWPI